MTKTPLSGSWRFGVPVGLGVLALTLGLLTNSPAQEKKESLPPELNVIPRDAAGFVSLRVAELWNDARVQRILADLAKLDFKFPKEIDPNGTRVREAKDIERLTVVMLKKPEVEVKDPLMVEVVTTIKPHDTARIIKEFVPMAKPTSVLGKTLYVDRHGALAILDTRSYALGTAHSLKAFLEDSGKPGTGPLTEALTSAAGKQVVTFAFNVDPLRELFGKPGDPTLEPVRPMFQARGISLGLDLAQGITLQGRLKFNNLREAEDGRKALLALLAMAAEALPGLEPVLNEVGFKGEVPRNLLKELTATAKSRPITLKENVVQVEVHLKTDLVALATSAQDALIRLRDAAARTSGSNNLHQIGLALHSYHDIHGHLPPAAICDKNGKPLLSWRVALLPYLEQENLYRKFKLDEPWDSEHNKPLSAQALMVFMSPGSTAGPKTHYRIFHGNGAPFEIAKSVKLADFKDGIANTILVVEAAEAVEWAKPDDFPYDPKKDLPKLGFVEEEFMVVFADGYVRSVAKKVDKTTLHALITRSGGEKVDLSSIPRE